MEQTQFFRGMIIFNFFQIILFALWSNYFLYMYTYSRGIEKASLLYSPDHVADIYKSALNRLTKHAKTEECKYSIEYEYMKYVRAMADDTPYPFEDEVFKTQCPIASDKYHPMGPVYSKAPQVVDPDPSNPNPSYPKDITAISPENLSILYVILVHNHPEFVVRLINALDEPQHTFVIHIDKKESEVRTKLLEIRKENVFFVDENDSVRVNWGGYSGVNATIQGMKYAWLLNRPFDYMQLLSGTTYPVRSNADIRTELSRVPGAIYMDVKEEPNRPSHEIWQHYVECDDKLHRIHRLSVVRGINMFIGSQWFAVPRHVVEWLLHDPLPFRYQAYAQYVVISDENYFSTLISNSPYCGDIIRQNNLFLLFDQWENESINRDDSKCLSPNPDTCGRSPATLTVEFKSLLQTSKALFARKFDPLNNGSMELVDEIDIWRENSILETTDNKGHVMIKSGLSVSGNKICNMDSELNTQDGNCSLSINSDSCWDMPERIGEPITLSLCNAAEASQWFTLGPCSHDTCVLQGQDACVDLPGSSIGNPIISWPCTGHWNQAFRVTSNYTISMSQPEIIENKLNFKSEICFEPRSSPYKNALGDNDVHLLSVLCFDTVDPLKNTEIVQNRLLYEFLKDDGDNHKKYGVKGVKNRQVNKNTVKKIIQMESF